MAGHPDLPGPNRLALAVVRTLLASGADVEVYFDPPAGLVAFVVAGDGPEEPRKAC